MYHQFAMEFSEWLMVELENRGWSRSEAARRGGISPSMFDKVINGYAKPGIKFLDGIATAFEMSPIAIYRKAGKFPDNGNGDQVKLEDWQYLLSQMTADEQEEIRQIIEMKIERRRKSEQTARAKNFKPGKVKK